MPLLLSGKFHGFGQVNRLCVTLKGPASVRSDPNTLGESRWSALTVPFRPSGACKAGDACRYLDTSLCRCGFSCRRPRCLASAMRSNKAKGSGCGNSPSHLRFAGRTARHQRSSRVKPRARRIVGHSHGLRRQVFVKSGQGIALPPSSGLCDGLWRDIRPRSVATLWRQATESAKASTKVWSNGRNVFRARAVQTPARFHRSALCGIPILA